MEYVHVSLTVHIFVHASVFVCVCVCVYVCLSVSRVILKSYSPAIIYLIM